MWLSQFSSPSVAAILLPCIVLIAGNVHPLVVTRPRQDSRLQYTGLSRCSSGPRAQPQWQWDWPLHHGQPVGSSQDQDPSNVPTLQGEYATQDFRKICYRAVVYLMVSWSAGVADSHGGLVLIPKECLAPTSARVPGSYITSSVTNLYQELASGMGNTATRHSGTCGICCI